MFGRLSHKILGAKLATSQLMHEKFSVFWGMPILASDAISSVAYAVDEMLWALIPAIGLLTYLWIPKISAAIILLLLVLTISYRQIVDAYPGGGGAYIVAKDNLKNIYGLIVGAALSIDYTLTVAVSISAATAAITSALPQFFPHRVIISIAIIALMVIGNLRGVRESSKLFSIPTYAFMVAVVVLIVAGVLKHSGGESVDMAGTIVTDMSFGTQAASLFIILRAFASGCAALTGVEAVSDAVPNFKEPARKNAKLAYVLLAASVLITFGGIVYLTSLYHPVPNSQQTVMAQLATAVFGRGTAFYIIQATTTIILAMAANTAFAGFPILLSIIGQDGYAPRQLALRGHRLNFSNGIVFLGLMAIVLVVLFKGDTHLLIPLYAVGVFTAFTLAQFGMLMRWFKSKPEGWQTKALINGIGAVITLITTIIISAEKFTAGAWIVFIIIPLLVMLMLRIKEHYNSVAKQLDVPNETLDQLSFEAKYNHHFIVPIASINNLVIQALRYARSLTPNVEGFHVETYEGEADKLKRKWALLNTDIKLVIKQSPYREIVEPLTEYLDSEGHSSQPGDMITVLLPQFIVSNRWEMALHNNTSLFIGRALFNKRNVAVSILPFYLEDLPKANKIKTPPQPKPNNKNNQ